MPKSYYQLLDRYPNYFEEQGVGVPSPSFSVTPKVNVTPDQAKLLTGGGGPLPMRAPAANDLYGDLEDFSEEDLTDEELMDATEAERAPAGAGDPSRMPGFDLESRGTDAVEEAMQLAGMSSRGMSSDPELKAKLQKQQQAQEESLNESQDIYEQLKAMPKRPDLTPLLNLTDTWTGSKLAQGYQAPATPEGRLADLLKFSDVVNKQRDQYTDSLVKQATAGGNSTMWRSLANLKARRTRNSEEDLYRISKQLAPAAQSVKLISNLNKEVGGFDNPNAEKELEGLGSWLDENSQSQWRTPRGNRIRSLADAALSQYVKMVTGLNATDAERAAYKASLGRDLFPSGQSVINGFKMLQEMIESEIQARQAGFGEDTVQLYEQQKGPTVNAFRKAMGAKPNMTPSERRARIEQLKAMKAQAKKGN